MKRPATVFGTHDDKTLEQIMNVAVQAEATSLMSDGHVGYTMPIGGVAAYDQQVSVVGVGFDIACGNCAIRTDLRLEDITDGLDRSVLDTNSHAVQQDRKLGGFAMDIEDQLSFGIGRKNRADDAPVDHDLFRDPAWYLIPNDGHYGKFRDELMDKARRQLGTIGSGNHYVDVFADEHGIVWVGVHFGSRGFGHTIASGYLALGQGKDWGDRVPEAEVLLDLSTPIGQDYYALMELAGRYAYAGREWVARKTVEILGGRELEMVHNHHNFAWREAHDLGDGERDLIVVRKGATPAFPGQRGFIGGSMGDDAVIVRGATPVLLTVGPEVDTDAAQKASLYSTVHGAGRVMSRTQAAGKRDRKTGQLKKYKEGHPQAGEVIHAGLVSPQMMKRWIDDRGVILKGGGLDEAPHAYRRLPAVLAEQGRTIETLHTLRPVIVCMSPADSYDPYKD
jgi:tRNA-splicing ligase RtcB